MTIVDDLSQHFPGTVETTYDGWPTVRVQPDQWHEASHWLYDRHYNFLASLTAVHWLENSTMMLVAHVYKVDGTQPIGEARCVLRTPLSDQVGTEIASIADIWQTAEWHEREIYDMFGIRFTGNPDLRRILMAMEYEGYPLRKDFDNRKVDLSEVGG